MGKGRWIQVFKGVDWFERIMKVDEVEVKCFVHKVYGIEEPEIWEYYASLSNRVGQLVGEWRSLHHKTDSVLTAKRRCTRLGERLARIVSMEIRAGVEEATQYPKDLV